MSTLVTTTQARHVRGFSVGNVIDQNINATTLSHSESGISVAKINTQHWHTVYQRFVKYTDTEKTEERRATPSPNSFPSFLCGWCVSALFFRLFRCNNNLGPISSVLQIWLNAPNFVAFWYAKTRKETENIGLPTTKPKTDIDFFWFCIGIRLARGE